MHSAKSRMAKQLMATVFLFVILDVPCLSAQTSASRPAVASNEQDARPPVTGTDLRIAKRARALLKSESTWNRADRPHIEGDQTTACQPSAKQISLYCALERATVEVSGKFEHRGAVMQEGRFVIEDAEPQWETKYQHLLVDYNNDSHTTFQDIQKVLQSVELHIAKRLRDND
jgi:hypothetical protein